jgi:hypothetical protein
MCYSTLKIWFCLGGKLGKNRTYSEEVARYLRNELHLCPGRISPDEILAICDYFDAGHSISELVKSDELGYPRPKNITAAIKTIRKIRNLFQSHKLDFVLSQLNRYPHSGKLWDMWNQEIGRSMAYNELETANGSDDAIRVKPSEIKDTVYRIEVNPEIWELSSYEGWVKWYLSKMSHKKPYNQNDGDSQKSNKCLSYARITLNSLL